MFGLLSGIHLSPDMAVSLAQQAGIDDATSLDMVRAIMQGGFTKPVITPITLKPGASASLPDKGSALQITANNSREMVTVVITREPISQHQLDTTHSP